MIASKDIRSLLKNIIYLFLISDEDQKVVKDYGVWGLKKFMGREYMGINRTTFIIDSDGKIEDIITKSRHKKSCCPNISLIYYI